MPTSKTVYLQNLRTTNTHLQSNSQIITDAPSDNHGQGEYFSPTDLCATSLTQCIITTIGIYCKTKEIEIAECYADTTKIMRNTPRAIEKISIDLHISIANADEQLRQIIERVAHTCPVARSLHPDIIQEITINWF